MDKLILAKDTASRALRTLEEIQCEPYSAIIRDATIQRFEYTFETIWKLLKIYLLDCQGIDVWSPKACFREALKINMLTPEQVEQGLVMTDDRNLTSHTYIEAIADAVYGRIRLHTDLMHAVMQKTQ